MKPPVTPGRKVEVSGLGTLLCESSGNGSFSFIGRSDEGIIVYSLPSTAIILTQSGLEFTENPTRRDYAYGSGGRYQQLERQLRSAKL